MLTERRIVSGDTIRRIRDGWGWTQQELADVLGVHKRTVSKWERGVLEVPHYRSIYFEKLDPQRLTSSRARTNTTVEF